MIKLKKCQWINRPQKSRILTSRSITFLSCSEHHFVHTTDQDEKITFTFSGPCECGIAVIFSIDQGLRLHPQGRNIIGEMDFLGIKSTCAWKTDEEVRTLTVEKKGDTLSFFAEDRPFTSFSFASIGASVSISFYSKGNGQTTFTFS